MPLPDERHLPLSRNPSRFPRDRPFVSPTATNAEQRQHLPPPLFPATMGHGFTGQPVTSLSPTKAGSTLSLTADGREMTSLEKIKEYFEPADKSKIVQTQLTKAFLSKLGGASGPATQPATPAADGHA